MTRRRLVCAVYTRKSTEEGLDQAFNSLEAQREACLAYVASQAGEGWVALPTLYDDGGFSGGSMERPALKRLLADVSAGKTDVVVVYKVDRLTRSLTDFARIVEAFDARGVSFVSVTQAFNTTTSMGRLTLNVLLSFAQFEREVTGERIRDKIAASKKKGMWMGGVVPLGYSVRDRSLMINPAEAETVRTVFGLYLKHRNTRIVKDEADRLGLKTKARPYGTGSRQGGVPFQRGHIHKVLTNPVYLGEIVHKGIRHAGAHAAIIDPATWEAVQEQLRANAVTRRTGGNAKVPSLLAGLLFDDTGMRISPSHANKNGRRYRYYTSRAARPRWRLPAEAVEQAVLKGIKQLLTDRYRLSKDVGLKAIAAGRLEDHLQCAAEIAERLGGAEPAQQRTLLLQLVERIVVSEEKITIILRASALCAKLVLQSDREEEHPDVADEIFLDLPVAFRRRGVETKLIIGEAGSAISASDPRLLALLAQAHQWFEELKSGSEPSVRSLARRHRVDSGDVSRILPLAFLAPDIGQAIFDGRQPPELTAARLKRIKELPLSWARQREILGFA